ncbi:MAG: hypothetical protein M3P50_11765 [Actinomycetota bacterium]|nr:hypothetical protein [Actinomycetota bacterium]
MTRRPPLLALATLLAALAVTAAPAAGSSTQESTFQDDNRLIYAPPERVRATLDELASLGVDRLRITVVWAAVAPNPRSRARPRFDAADPDAYPPGAWDRYEVVTREARARGMDVSFNLTAPAPLWATGRPPREDVAETFEPSPQEFGAFAAAAGRRFDGAAGRTRVSHWSIWNEPNQSGWLTPQFADAGGGRFADAAPRLYRGLLDAAYGALHATGHGRDTILIGETAPKGDASRGVKRRMKALVFVRGLYCIDAQGRPLTGRLAADLACDPPDRFRARHPGLFDATGFAHHPYELLLDPSTRQSDPDFVTLSSLGRLTKTLDAAFSLYGVARRLPLHLTEYGYQTDPPDELSGVPYARQAAYLNESEYLAWRDARVQTLAQFLLFDDGDPIGTTFQSGLRTFSGQAKPALDAYRLPVWVARPTVRRGAALRVWGMLRSAPNGRPAGAVLQLRSGRSAEWRTVRQVRTTNPRGYFTTSFRLRSSGRVRVAYAQPGGDTALSREVAVRAKPQPRKRKRRGRR